MKLRKININGFGKFENRQFSLSPGMNVIYGVNESGKSTLQFFIRGMLYGLKGGKRTKDGSLPPMKQYKPWTAKTYGGSLEYELDNGNIFTVTRNFDKNTVNVYDEYSNNITATFPASKEEGIKFAEQHLGMSENCFERTVFIGQMQSVINSEGKKVIAERLTNIKQTGDEEVSFRKAINALKDAQMTYVGSERTTTRPLNLINASLQEAIEEESKYRELHESCLDMFLELERLQKKENVLKNRLAELEELKSKAEKRQETERLEKICRTLKRCQVSLSDIEKEIGAKKEELGTVTASLNEYEAFRKFSRSDMDEMISDYANYSILRREIEKYETSLAEIEDRIGGIQEELKKYDLFSEDNLEKIDEVVQEVIKFRERADSDNQERARSPLKKYLSLAGLISGIIILLFSFLLKPYNPAITAAGLAVSIAAGVSFLFFLRQDRIYAKETEQNNSWLDKYKESARLLNTWMVQVGTDSISDFIRLKNMFEERIKRLHELTEEKNKLKDGKNNALEEIKEFETRILDKLISSNLVQGPAFGEEEINRWKHSLETCSTLVQAARELESSLSSLNQKKESLYREASLVAGFDINTLTELEKELREKSCELEKVKAELEDRDDISDSSAPGDIELDIRQTEEELEHTKLEISRLSARLENIPDDEMIQKAHEKVLMLTEERNRKLNLGKALEIAMEVLTEASVDIQRNYSPYLNETMGSIMEKITGGKYKDIMADDSLKLNIQTPDTAERVNPEQLSSGTADQVYFALRLATVMLIEKDGETLPLFLDDSFVQYDEERTKNVLRFLCEESEKRQIILFTCKKREVELAREVFAGKDINIINL